MRLEGIHHITAITGDAPGNVDFYARVLGLRLVKKTVNQDDPTVYHLFYADEKGSPGSDITFFEYPGARRGQAGDGMVHRVSWRVASEEALDFWETRLGVEGTDVSRTEGSLTFADPEGLGLELVAVETADDPLIAESPEIPSELALQGFHGVRATRRSPTGAAPSSRRPSASRVAATRRSRPAASSAARCTSTTPRTIRPSRRGHACTTLRGPSPIEEHEAWRQRVQEAGATPTPVIDRFYFKSIYFREPSGVLFEIATMGPGFTADEPLETLGERLSLPPNYEQLRDQVEPALTPLPNPREAWAAKS